MMIITQVLIFTIAWFVMTPDTLEDNTYVFGLIGNVEVIPGNTQWVMLCAMVLSVINIIVWWPKASTHQVEAKAEEAKAADPDPIVPKMD